MSVRFFHGTPLVWAGLLVTASSCSLIYDADVFQYIDARPVDAMRALDASIPPDADPTRLALEQLDPPQVVEGAGCVPAETGCRSDSRAVPIVITGANIMPGATVTLSGSGLDGASPDLVVNQEGTMAAFAISVPVLPELTDGMLGSIEVIVSQGGISENIVLPVRGLDDFVASVDAPAQTFAVASLRARYARILLDAPVTFTGATRVKLEATAELVVSAAVNVDGRNGSGQSGGAGGPGGCSGGNAQANGTCEGGGRVGGNSGGGGGGGHAVAGTSASGAGGAATGSPILTPLAPAGADTARGHGGGGGGNCLSAGGGGGGGGGSLELTSGGALQLTATALLSAKGGNGAAGAGGLCTNGSAGSGGGGSGGAILVRAALAFLDEGADARVNVDPGQGGGGGNPGGTGAPGRLRFDLPGDIDTSPAFSGVIHQYRGPVWDPAIPAVTTEGALDLRLFGGAAETVFIDVEGQSRRELAFPDDGVLQVPVNLPLGASQVCARVTNGPHANQPDAANCFDIAYIRLL